MDTPRRLGGARRLDARPGQKRRCRVRQRFGFGTGRSPDPRSARREDETDHADDSRESGRRRQFRLHPVGPSRRLGEERSRRYPEVPGRERVGVRARDAVQEEVRERRRPDELCAVSVGET
ncbi:hypothetical protein C2R22_10185 [Salinigranum rubrum]|uniref:Uncharacterized protein n=1 Tax=Salinigranum rubrum TaxID=755307 RepID=A0A2I8VJ77_9EURY|nr:hypothetical protein [Salinigranum rubrum]AUV81970.1 hypothetical protein C2R22_10185 [Salinigranum rubrum]